MSDAPIVFVVDDDERACRSVCALAQSMGLECKSFSTAEQFLGYYSTDRAGCLVTDVRMLGISGLELQEKLNEMGSLLPVIIMTAYATTPVTVRAMKSGALTMLDKPYHEDQLWDAIRKALSLDAQRRVQHERRHAIRQRMEQLTPSERDVLQLVVSGKANKVIACILDVSVRTVENRRRDVYRKMDAESAVDLVRMVIEADAENVES
jgi:FixJ family two-component response regulator